MGTVEKTIYHKYYIDEVYDATITKPLKFISEKLYQFFELRFIDAGVNATGSFVNWMSGILRYAQTGNIGYYVFAMVIGVILIFVYQFI